jgi:hypothetical protein
MVCPCPSAPSRGATRIIGLVTGLLALAGCSKPRPPLQTMRLVPTPDTLLAPYGEITDAAWLGGSRWVVIAPQDRAVGVADFQRKQLARFGGGQAHELEQPFHLFRSDDSVYVADWFRRRLTRWSLTGRLGGAYPALDVFRGVLPRARDSAGAWYLEIRPSPGRDGRGNLDSGAVVRTRPDFSGADTVARLAPFDLAEVVSDGRRRLERRLLSGQDRWGVLADGSVWVARVAENRVDWRAASGKVTRGAQLPDRVLPVTQNDRDLFLNRFDAGLRPTVSEIPFAAIKPPFEAVLPAPTGRLWLVKSRAVGDSLRNYQVIDAGGGLVGEATHPGHGRILALGDGYALVGEPFAGGVRLLSYRLPSDAAADGH